jgi:serine/threonine-protein kinase
VIRDAELVARVRLVASSDRAGTVIEQSPGAGAAATDGATVRLDVAKARTPAVTRIEVPDVVGSSASAARTALRGVGLTVATTTVASRQPAGTVVSQTPAAGSDVRKGTRVRLTISSGPTLVDVPDVTGLDESSARSELERAGLTVQVTAETVADPGQDGVVLRQTPAGGASAEDGATVTIVVGRFD